MLLAALHACDQVGIITALHCSMAAVPSLWDAAALA